MLDTNFSENIRNVGTLLLGVGGSQLVGILAMLGYTRLYDPASIGVMGIFISFVVILRLMSNGGYEAAIVLPESDKEATDLLNLCFGMNAIILGVSILVVLLSDGLITSLYPESDGSLRQVIWLLPFSVLFESGALALKYWLNRFKKYRVITRARFAQAILTALVSLYLGWQGQVVYGLIIGLVIGQGIQWGLLFYGSALGQKWQFDWNGIRMVFKKYRQFLKYGVVGAWFNSLASEAPFLILPRFFGEDAVGFFNVARKVLFGPINLVGGSISTVYYEQGSKAELAGGTALKDLTQNTVRYMLLMSAIPTLVIFFFAPSLFAFFYGEEFRVSGVYASWLMPWVFIKFISHPLSYLVDIKMKLQAQFLYNSILFIGQAGILIAMGLYFTSLEAVIGYGIAGLILSGGYLVFLLRLGFLPTSY